MIKDQSILHQNCPENNDVGLSREFKGYVTTLLRYDKSNLSESTDNLLLQTLEVLFLSFYYSRNWNLIYRSCLRASYRSEGRGERKQKNVPWPHASPFPPSLSLPSRGWFENSLLYWFLPFYISRPVYGQIIFHSIFKICGRIRMVWSLKWNLFSTSTWYYLFSTLFWRLSLWMKSYCYQSNETSSAVLSHGTIYLVCSSNFWVCGWNPMVLPFKWNLFSSTFTWYYLYT